MSQQTSQQETFSGNLLVAQGGCPTPVVNASLAGVISEALNHEDEIVEIYGALNGVTGILNEQLIDLASESQQTVRALRQTPGAALGAGVSKLEAQADFDRVLDVFAAHDIRYFIQIGGNDSQDTAAKINAAAAKRDYALRVIGVPKAIDNDLAVTDHCPGYGSVIKHIASTVREISFDNAATGRHDFVSILEVLGRDAGWIAAGAVLAKRRNALLEDPPHLILLPEEPFNQSAFIDAVQATLRKQKYCFVVVAEGVKDPEGNPLGADVASADASIGAGEFLRTLVEQNISGVKARAAKLGISQRTASLNTSKTDGDEAYLAGQAAVKAAVAGETGKMVTLVRDDKDATAYSVRTDLAPLEDIANSVKPFPASWIGEDKMSVSYAFTKYATPLIQGENTVPFDSGLPKFAILAAHKVERDLEPYSPAQ
ncbi:MAG: 6-phosphofructokinase [Puniceicoccales bacterium]|nr:6-phosphofructokinase [Puniceicoccales bacterium]